MKDTLPISERLAKSVAEAFFQNYVCCDRNLQDCNVFELASMLKHVCCDIEQARKEFELLKYFAAGSSWRGAELYVDCVPAPRSAQHCAELVLAYSASERQGVAVEQHLQWDRLEGLAMLLYNEGLNPILLGRGADALIYSNPPRIGLIEWDNSRSLQDAILNYNTLAPLHCV